MKGSIIIIAGMPASGKSTAARKLSAHYHWPVLEKDEIKEELFDTLGFASYSEKRKLDAAATAVLVRCASSILRGGDSLILVNNFRQEALERLMGIVKELDSRAVFVFFQGDNDVFYKRYVERDLDTAHLRHIGHIVQEHYPLRPGESCLHTMTREEFREKFEKLGMADIQADCRKIAVDATDPGSIDLEYLINEIDKALGIEERM